MLCVEVNLESMCIQRENDLPIELLEDIIW